LCFTFAVILSVYVHPDVDKCHTSAFFLVITWRIISFVYLISHLLCKQLILCVMLIVRTAVMVKQISDTK
jgi:hypothetical protein